MSKKDFYQILGINKSSTKEEIKSSYRKLAMQYHPDRNPNNKDAEEKFKEASEAYEVLSDESKRAQYDQLGHAGFQNMGGNQHHNMNMDDIFANFGDIFGDMFNQSGASNKNRKKRTVGPQPHRGSDLYNEITITLLDAFIGKKEEFRYYHFTTCEKCNNKGMQEGTDIKTCNTCKGHGQVQYQQGFFAFSQPCNTCNGQGFTIPSPCSECKGQSRIKKYEKFSVNIPAGIYENAELRIAEKGDAGVFGGAAGDLFLKIHISNFEKFKRENDDLICKITVTYPQLVLGCHVEIENIDGTKESLKIPKGCAVGEKITIPGKGFPSLRNKTRGNLVVITYCHIPSKLSHEAKTTLENYSSMIGTEVSNDGSSILNFFKKFLG